jgi:FixJ family two-component response regulator
LVPEDARGSSVVVSGHGDVDIRAAGVDPEVVPVLRKPFSMGALVNRVRDAIDRDEVLRRSPKASSDIPSSGNLEQSAS